MSIAMFFFQKQLVDYFMKLVNPEFDQFYRNIPLAKYLLWMQIRYILIVIKPSRDRVIQNSRSIEIILEVVFCLQITCEVHSVL